MSQWPVVIALPASGACLEVLLEDDTEIEGGVASACDDLFTPSQFVVATQVVLNQLEQFWPKHPLLITPSVHWLWDIVVTDNAGIKTLNQVHRQQNKPTDVLSFPGADFSPEVSPRPESSSPVLPVQSLGSVVISLEWAKAHAGQCERASVQPSSQQQLGYFVLDRLMHGLLHILGQHHDTMVAYERVVACQTIAVTQALAVKGGP